MDTDPMADLRWRVRQLEREVADLVAEVRRVKAEHEADMARRGSGASGAVRRRRTAAAPWLRRTSGDRVQ